MNILVTGGTGFIGTRLTSYLAGQGETVHTLGLPPAAPETSSHPNIRSFFGDILSPADVERAMEGCDRVFHLAGYARNWAPHPRTFYDINVLGTETVLAAALKLGVRRVVHTSSNLTLGPSNGAAVTENTIRTTPFFTDYECSKFLSEDRARTYCGLGLEVVIVNPTRVFGPGPLNESNSVTKMISMYLAGTWRFVPGDGQAIGNNVFLEDLVRGYDAAMRYGRPGERYLLGGENISFNAFFDTLGSVTGCRHRIIHLPSGFALLLSREEQLRATLFHSYPLITPGWARIFLADWACSSGKAMNEFGYGITPFREAIRQTVSWLTTIHPHREVGFRGTPVRLNVSMETTL